MTAPVHGRMTAFLRRAGLLAGILAIIAGILGMHVMTGTHSMHAPAAVTASADTTVHAESAAADGHAGHQTAGTPAAHRASGAQDRIVAAGQSCSCSGNCTGMQAMAASCIPSAQTGSLAAPLPGTPGFTVNVSAGMAGAATGHYSYLPGSPSPGELSISRT